VEGRLARPLVTMRSVLSRCLPAALAALLPVALLPAQGFRPLAEQLHVFDGVTPDGQRGWSVAAVGDLTLDGVPDLVFGAPHEEPGGLLRQGAVLVADGATGQLIHEIAGSAIGDGLGATVCGVGDLDGDGAADLLLGAPFADPGGRTNAGVVELRSGFGGALLRRFEGEVAGDLLGSALAGPGDLDGDGLPDLLIGARGADPAGLLSAGAAYLRSGADGSLLRRFDGGAVGEQLGRALAAAGDVDGDGTPDLWLGAPFAAAATGSVRLHSGADGSELLRLTGGAVGDQFGWALADAGDVDGDGTPDLLVGAPTAAPGGRLAAGYAAVRSGASGAELLRIEGLVADDEFGGAVAGIGDANADGVPDLLVGATGYDFGGRANVGGAFVLSGVDGGFLLRLTGADSGDRIGASVAGPGDLDGDGTADLLVGGWGADTGAGAGAGRVEAWLCLLDSDGDLLADRDEALAGTDPMDQDSDDDGLADGEESATSATWTGTDPLDADTDGDLLQDGTELGRRRGQPGDPGLGVLGTDPAVFLPDRDPSTTTDPLDPDSDGGGIDDGAEDVNLNGRVEPKESDPNDGLDDRVQGLLSLNPATLSAGAGGLVTMTIDFHPGMGGDQFRVLGSMTGTDPGFSYGGIAIPLVYDALTVKMARQEYEPSMQNFSGALDADGDAVALLLTLPGELTPWIGRSFWWSVLSLEGTIPSNATNAAVLTITP
jgi:hypothetical protein